MLVRRAHFIIGYKSLGNIAPLFTPEGKRNVIFDSTSNHFITLTLQELDKLGVSGRCSVVRALDEVLVSNIEDPRDIMQETFKQNNRNALNPNVKQPFKQPLNPRFRPVDQTKTMQQEFEQSSKHTVTHTDENSFEHIMFTQ